MKVKTTTITFGVSSHYFKSSVSLTYEDEGNTEKEYKKALRLARREYFKALAEELSLRKKFDKMNIDEIEEFIKEKVGIE